MVSSARPLSMHQHGKQWGEKFCVSPTQSLRKTRMETTEQMPEVPTCPVCAAELTEGSCIPCLLRLVERPAAGTELVSEQTDNQKRTTDLTGQRFDDYEVLARIDEGGMGEVYKARQLSLGREVALKTILSRRETIREIDIKRFHQEARAVAGLKHPNIVPVYDFGEHQGRHYFTMELVEGGSLSHRLSSYVKNPRKSAELLVKVAKGVHHAHQRGILHRDLKPGNILFDQHGEPRVTDFGLAKLLETENSMPGIDEDAAGPAPATSQRAQLTEPGVAAGTAEYMSPEQAEGKNTELTTAVDVWSLGVILYQLMTGRLPFTSHESNRTQRVVEILCKVVAEKPQKPSLINSKMDKDLEAICLACLQKEPQRRYGSADALADELERWLRGEPVMRRPCNAWERATKWTKRKPALAALVAVIGVAAVACALLAVIAVRKANQTSTTLNQLEIQRAEEFFAANNSPLALPYLADVLRRDPANRIAAQRLLSALSQRNFALPATSELKSKGPLFNARFSSNGQHIITHSEADVERIWDATTGKLISERSENTQSPASRTDPDIFLKTMRAYNASFDRFSADGKRVVTVTNTITNGVVLVWDVATSQQLTKSLNHESLVSVAKLSRDGKRVITVESDPLPDHTLRLWEVSTSKQLMQTDTIDDHLLYSGFSPNGERLTTLSSNVVRVWDAFTGQLLTDGVKHDTKVHSASFNADGRQLVTVSEEFVRVWDVDRGQPLTDLLKHSMKVRHAEFSADGRSIISATDNMLQVWDSGGGQPVIEPIRCDPKGWFVGRLSPDGMRLLTSIETGLSRDGMRFRTSIETGVVIWDLHVGQAFGEPIKIKTRFRGDSRFVGRWIVSSSPFDLQIWDVQTGQAVSPPLKQDSFVLSFHVSSDGKYIVIATGANTRVWEVRTGKLVCELDHKNPVQSASFSPDGQMVVTTSDLFLASDDKTARIWETRSGRHLFTLPHKDEVESARFSPDGKQILTVEYAQAQIWNVHDGKRLRPFTLQHDDVSFADYSRDGKQVVTASSDGTARVWNAHTGKPLTQGIRHNDSVYHASFSPNGTMVVTASEDKTARVWDAFTGKPLTEPIKHESEVVFAQFDRDGQSIFTLSGGVIRAWDARTGLLLTEPIKTASGIREFHLSADGRQITTASQSGAIQKWEVWRPPLPVPHWLPRLAEAVAGLRLDDQKIADVDREELWNLKFQLANKTEPDFYTKWVRWFLGNRAARTISPFSAITIPEFLQQCIEENTLDSLEEAVRLAPTNALALARLAHQILAQTENHKRFSEVDCLSRRAVELSRNDPEVWWRRAEVLDRAGNLPGALDAMDRGSKGQSNPDFWIAKGELLEKTNRLDEAYQAFSRAIELAGKNGNSRPIQVPALRKRSNFLKRLNRFPEAQADFLQFQGIPARDPQANSNLIDLTPHYNASLTLQWIEHAWPTGAIRIASLRRLRGEGSLISLPRGIHNLAGLEFDLRGLIQLGSESPFGETYSNQVFGITIGRHCKRLHFLHAAVNESSESDGTQIGSYVVHYDDGRTIPISIILGQDLAHWRQQTNELRNALVPAWMQSEESAEKEILGPARLFKKTWENPSPEAVVKSVDFLSSSKGAAPFLVAITAE